LNNMATVEDGLLHHLAPQVMLDMDTMLFEININMLLFVDLYRFVTF